MTIKVICRTNLDLFGEVWPSILPAVPRVGDLIRSSTTHGLFKLELEVVRVTWIPVYSKTSNQVEEYLPEIELGMSSMHRMLPCLSGKGETGSVIAFYEWYAPLVGRSVSSFI